MLPDPVPKENPTKHAERARRATVPRDNLRAKKKDVRDARDGRDACKAPWGGKGDTGGTQNARAKFQQWL